MAFDEIVLACYRRFQRGEDPWVRVTESLPPLDKPVLAWVDGKYICIAEIPSGDAKNGMWAFHNDWLYTPTEPVRLAKRGNAWVTHWMPLPPPPKNWEPGG